MKSSVMRINYNETDTDFSLELLGDITIVFYFDANDMIFSRTNWFWKYDNRDGNQQLLSATSNIYRQHHLLELNGKPNLGWEMGYWSSNNHSFSPTTTNENVNIVTNSTDTIILHLNQQQFDLTYILEPPNAEVDIDINGNVISTFPHTTTEFYGTNISLEAKSNLAWDFAYMTSNNGYFTEHSISPFISFNVDKSDTITIYYDANIFHNVSYEVIPKGSGQIRANDILIGDTIVTIPYPNSEVVNLEAIASNGWRFSHWISKTIYSSLMKKIVMFISR